jgi:single-strand DNA-binding protein
MATTDTSTSTDTSTDTSYARGGTAPPRRPPSTRKPGAANRAVSEVEPVNEVVLVGRLAAIGELKTLPSGDELRPFRLVVDRPRIKAAGADGARRVDTIDCHALRATARRQLERLDQGDIVEIKGALRRRFFRGAVGLASRYEVEVAAIKRVRGATG